MRNRFKGLDLIDRVPDELWNEVRDIVQETGIKTIPIEKKCKKAKWLSGEGLQIAVKRSKVKSKGEKALSCHHCFSIYHPIFFIGKFPKAHLCLTCLPSQSLLNSHQYSFHFNN